VVAAFNRHFGGERMHEVGPATTSEDFGLFGTVRDVQSVFWVIGGTNPETFRTAQARGKVDELPFNHAPFRARDRPNAAHRNHEMLVAASRSAALRDPAGPDEGAGLVGTLAFAFSGAPLGVQKQFDLFGVLFLSVVVAVVARAEERVSAQQSGLAAWRAIC
jgi:Glycine transporter